MLLVWFLAQSTVLGGQARIDSISPAQGPIAGGTTVKLTGAGLTGTKVTLDGKTITPISVSDSQIVFQTPKHDNGIASVQVSGNGPNAYAEFLYLPPALKDLPPGYITTVMGMGTFRGNGRQATNAVLGTGSPGLAIAPDGSILVSESSLSTIRRIRPDGVIEAFAGTVGNAGGCCGGYGDGGPALAAGLFQPRGIAFDASGNLFLANSINLSSIRRIDAVTGVITTVIGGETTGYSGDGGPASQALLNQPLQIAFDGAGNLYILECGGISVCTQPRIRKVDTKGIITTIAGTGVAGFSGDGGPALSATFDLGAADSGGLAADAAGNVFLADQQNGRIRRIDARTGIMTTFIDDILGPNAVNAVATDPSGNVYVGNNNFDSPLGRILMFSPSGTLLRAWGKGLGFTDDGAAAVDAALGNISRIQIDASGSVVFAEYDSSRIRRIDASTGQLRTVAGMGPHIIGETGPALATVLSSQGGLAFLPDGELLIADGGNLRVRKMDTQANVSDIAGDGFIEFVPTPAQIPALQAHVCPLSEAVAPNGDLYISNYLGAGILRLDSSGTLYAVTADGQGYNGDGKPASLSFVDAAWDLAVDATGNVYIADSNNNRIRRIDAQTGIFSSVAGNNPPNGYENYGQGSYCGDGGPATSACLNTPYGIAVAPDGTLYIGENGQRIRKVDPSGIISTLFSDGGWTTRLYSGNVFTPPYRIQPNGHAFQFAWSGESRGDGGPTNEASLGLGSQGRGIAIDSEGNLFLSELSGLRVRAIRFGAVVSEPGSSVVTSGGTPQSAVAGRAFPAPLQVTLTSPVGTLENGIRIDFAAPASGPSCVFSGGGSTYSTLTDVSGHATAVCTANSRSGAYAVTATPLNLGVFHNKSATFSLANSAPPPPKIGGNGIVNGASFDATKPDRIAPGALISIFGTGLSTQSGVQTAKTLPVPTQLGGTQVLINGVAAPIFAVIGNPSFDQINLQVPFEVAGATTGSVVVRVTGQPDSVPELVAIDPVSPAIFTVSSGGQGPAAVQHSANFALVTNDSPAKPGEAVVIYCTGLGMTGPPASTGDRGSTAEPFNRTLETPVVTIGGKAAQVLFSAAAPCCAALYQINVLVPPDTPAGDRPLVITMPTSNVVSRSGVTINVQP
jgi:uncharacterized protein (TIGR03437 family)